MLRMEEVVREWDGGGGEVNEQGLPPGFRFHPTDEELITFYLASKVFHGTFSGVDIPQVDFNRCEPWDLPESAKMGGIEWYFFSVRDRKYPTGLRTNRATGAGYWKATGKDRRVYGAVNGALLGMKKTLVFYRGRAPRGLKTRWVMHEYRLDGHFSCRHTCKEEWVICKIFLKPGQKRRPQVQAQPPPSPPPFPNIINSPPALLEPPPPPPDSLHLNPLLIHQHLKYLPTSLDHLSSEPNLSLLNSPQASFPRPTFPPSTTTTTTAVNKITATNHQLPSINFKSLLWHQDYCCTNGKEQYQPQQKQPTAAAATTIAKQCKTEANFSRVLQVPRDSHNINNNINLQFSQSHWLHRSSQISPPPSLSPCPPQYPLDFGTGWSGFDFRADVAALEVAASGVEPRLSVEAPHIEVAGESWPLDYSGKKIFF